MPEENTKSSSQPSQPSDQREPEIKEATVGLVADLKTLKQLTSSSAAVKAKREQNALDKVLGNRYLDV
ncbi:hypothetical protein EMCG_05677 [[Emmonsia] crescens]|uniref:Uncharacterized protein n=1 Tax=[Emmonsia] crescens TaxID=73230 RepID=A0A0G2JC68_9EURO|nr:hypothetical protein EMCG_05677 [Emmonsia crescens UAMH 3008]